MLMPNDDKVINNVDISVGVLSLLWTSLLWKTQVKLGILSNSWISATCVQEHAHYSTSL